MSSNAAWSIFEDKPNIVSPPNQYLSFYDLKGVVGFSSALMTENLKEFERILYQNGADTTKPYNVVKCLHRPRISNNPFDGFRVEFTERTDKEWRSTGAASLEAWLFSSKDKSLQQEMIRMSRERNNSVEREYESRNFNKD